MIHAEKDRGNRTEAAEGVTLSGVQTNTKLHEDITLEIPAADASRSRRGTGGNAVISQAKGQSRIVKKSHGAGSVLLYFPEPAFLFPHLFP